MSHLFQSFAQIKKILRGVDSWFDKAEGFAKARSFDPDLFISGRLAVDQLPLPSHVDIACDVAKFGASRLSGKNNAPKNEDGEKTLAELRARVQSCITYLDTFSAADFEHASDSRINMPASLDDKTMSGDDYLHEFVLPNFYFHTTTIYSILRSSGVDLGKLDFLQGLTLKDKA